METTPMQAEEAAFATRGPDMRQDKANAIPPDTADVMTASSFRLWRKRMGWRQQEAARHLGLSKRIIQYYEKGDRDGQPVQIPLSVRLACYALSRGVQDYNGQIASPLEPIPTRSTSRRPTRAAGESPDPPG